jgi:hypothetical protein
MNRSIYSSRMKLIRHLKCYRRTKKDKLLSMSTLSRIVNLNLYCLPISAISLTGLGLIRILWEYPMLIAKIKIKLATVSNVSIWLKSQPLCLLKHPSSYLLLMLNYLSLLILYSRIFFLKTNQRYLEYSRNRHRNSKHMCNMESYE